MPDFSVHAIIAQLPSTNLDRTSRFYLQLFGCREVGRFSDLLILEWDRHELHFWLTTDPAAGEVSSCYIRVTGIEALYAQCAKVEGLVHPRGALQRRLWGMAEFYAVDPDGNLLKFGEPLIAGIVAAAGRI